ncbi:hypothetical protein UPYG_G00176110 [Umbra pygmaea]|uniref:CCDC66 domain-containing protein n=1 Tax=Umbra pygmaea TaxID=75934 RepID=A0ABD0WQ10_UMBPY
MSTAVSAKMNLGDGLFLELENGKPKLILTNQGVELKNQNKIISRSRPLNALNSKQYSHDPVSEESHTVQIKCVERRKAAPVSNTVPGKNHNRVGASIPIKATVKGSADHNSKVVTSIKGHRPIATDRQVKTSVKTVKESLVCMTNEQLQQILSTINKAPTSSSLHQDVNGHPQTGNTVHFKEDTLLVGNGGEVSASRNENSKESTVGERVVMGALPDGLLSSLGKREVDKNALEAKRTQWRRELDEQMTLKKQQKDLSRPDVIADCILPGGTAVSSKSGPGDGRTVQQGNLKMLAGLEDGNSSQRDLPAAIRSAFVVGEATPVEHAYSAQKKEQQRRWLQDLDQQRQEDKRRRQQEKQQLSQAEDHEHWAMHFDSHQMRGPLQAPLVEDRGHSEPLISLIHQRTRSGALSVACDGAVNRGEDGLGRESVDIPGGIQQKARHLRTMTALLDPAQIEDRERKRLKQLEHQRAIEAQVEEKKRKREAEEAARKAQEEEEERRVEHERELLQRQYQMDTERKTHKEEQQSRKQEALHLSVQRAQEEAMKDKRQQRIRKLARNGHNVSMLQRSVGEDPGSSLVLNTRDSPSPVPHYHPPGRKMDTLREEVCSASSSRKDTVVQTEVDPAGRPGCTCSVAATFNSCQAVQTPDIPVEYRPPPPAKNKRFIGEARQEARLAQKNPTSPRAGKENVWLKDLGGGGGGAVDVYEAFARNNQGQRILRAGVRRPEWNIQKPSKPYVPASERYPTGLQNTRQEKRLRRQMELMTLVERNTRSPQLPEPDPTPGSTDPSPPHVNDFATTRQPATNGGIKNAITGVTHAMAVHTKRGTPRSPPVPALKHRLQNQPASSHPTTRTQTPSQDADSLPPTSDYVPYLRTDEVYHMDPLAPISRPATQTQTQQQTHTDVVTDAVRCSPVHPKDPLLHPELLKNTERQQAILKSLSKLRQGLLQKQRELETGLNPLMVSKDLY